MLPSSTPHILLIDDNKDIVLMIKTMLNLKSFNVSINEDFDNIESTVRELAPDIILMDMLLSGQDGCQICKQLKANPEFSHIPILMISAHPEGKKKCEEAGANFFLEKPFEMKKLFEAIDDVL